jgi:hypothetical protein
MLGSNFKIFDRTLSFSIEKPFSLIPKKGLKANWLPLTYEIRKYFSRPAILNEGGIPPNVKQLARKESIKP